MLRYAFGGYWRLGFAVLVVGVWPGTAGARQARVANGPAAAECVGFASPGRLQAGTPFVAPLMRGLEFRLTPTRNRDPEAPPSWHLAVGPAGGTETDYLWVASPPLRTAPHLTVGPSYGMSAVENLQIERPLRFVVGAADFDRRLAAVNAAQRGDTSAFESLGPMTLGRVGFYITDYEVVGENIEWFTFEGEACIPGEPVGPIATLGKAARLPPTEVAIIQHLVEGEGPVWLLNGPSLFAPPGAEFVDVYLQPSSVAGAVRRGWRIQVSRQAVAGRLPSEWRVGTDAGPYAQVPLGPGDPVDESATDFPFRLWSAITDRDLLSLVRFVRQGPSGPQRDDGTSILKVDGTKPISSIRRNRDRTFTVSLRVGLGAAWVLTIAQVDESWRLLRVNFVVA